MQLDNHYLIEHKKYTSVHFNPLTSDTVGY